MTGVLWAAAFAALAASCAELPRDPARTEDQVRASRTIRLGWVTGTPRHPDAERVLSELARATGARPLRSDGDSETLLRELEEGKIDMVYGTFSMASPWAKMVHLGKALGWRAEPPSHVAAPRFAYRSGENGWIMRVESAVAREVPAP